MYTHHKIVKNHVFAKGSVVIGCKISIFGCVDVSFLVSEEESSSIASDVSNKLSG